MKPIDQMRALDIVHKYIKDNWINEHPFAKECELYELDKQLARIKAMMRIEILGKLKEEMGIE